MTEPATTDTNPAPKPSTSDDDVLTGMHQIGLDQRSRMTIPADWRALMGNPTKVMVMKDWTDKGLIILPPEETAQYKKMVTGKMINKKVKRLSLIIGKSSEYVPFDSQGRLRLSDSMLAHAGITTTATIVACGNRIQIYAPEVMSPDEPFNMEDLAGAMEEFEEYNQ